MCSIVLFVYHFFSLGRFFVLDFLILFVFVLSFSFYAFPFQQRNKKTIRHAIKTNYRSRIFLSTTNKAFLLFASIFMIRFFCPHFSSLSIIGLRNEIIHILRQMAHDWRRRYYFESDTFVFSLFIYFEYFLTCFCSSKINQTFAEKWKTEIETFSIAKFSFDWR